jgi:hypothetical protein
MKLKEKFLNKGVFTRFQEEAFKEIAQPQLKGKFLKETVGVFTRFQEEAFKEIAQPQLKGKFLKETVGVF